MEGPRGPAQRRSNPDREWWAVQIADRTKLWMRRLLAGLVVALPYSQCLLPSRQSFCCKTALASMKASIYIATSVDGMIADKDGDIDWLNNQPQIEGEDHGFQEFLDSIDVLIMGRNTFEKVVSFGEEAWAYGNRPVIVMSRGSVKIPDYLLKKVSSSSLEPKQLLEKLESEGYKHAYVDGGFTIRKFLKQGLIQRIILTTIPIILGDGIRLFLDQGPVGLELVQSRSWSNGMVQSVYQVREKG